MSWLRQWIHEMKDLETDECRTFMDDEFGPLLRLSLIAPDFNYPVRYFTATAIMIPMVWSQGLLFGYTSTLLMDQLDYCIFDLHISLLNLAGIVFFFHITRTRRAFYAVTRFMGGEFYDYNEPPHPDLPMVQKELTREKYLMFIVPIIVAVACVLLVCGPWIDEYLGVAPSEVYNAAGVNMKLLIPCYYPFPTHEGILHIFIQGLQSVAVCYIGVLVGCADYLYVVASLRLVFQLRALILSLRTIDKRAEMLFIKKFGNEAKRGNKDNEYEKCLEYCLGQNVAHHKIIKSAIENYDEVAGFPILMAYSIGTVVIAMSMYSLAQASSDFKTQDVTFFVTALAEILNMFMISYFGEKLGVLSEDLYNEIYSMNWPNYHKKFVNSLMIFHVGAKKSLIMSAGGLMDCNMETFSTVMNSAYSYFNLLNAAK